MKVSVAESLTGGLISSILVNQSGISKIYKGGIVCYSIESKIKLLNVPEDIANNNDSVSPEVSDIMSLNICKLFDTDIGIGTTGFAEKTDYRQAYAYLSVAIKGKIGHRLKIVNTADSHNTIRVENMLDDIKVEIGMNNYLKRNEFREYIASYAINLISGII